MFAMGAIQSVIWIGMAAVCMCDMHVGIATQKPIGSMRAVSRPRGAVYPATIAINRRENEDFSLAIFTALRARLENVALASTMLAVQDLRKNHF